MHGGKQNINKFLHELSNLQGFRLAENGEFTKRAFLNNKISLLKAEGINHFIHSTSEHELELSSKLMNNQGDEKIKDWYDRLKNVIINLQAYIDFGDDIGYFENEKMYIESKIFEKVRKIYSEMSKVLQTKNMVKTINQGLDVAIIGGTNVGKSTFMNLISDKNISIVTNIQGTTRDVISNQIQIGGYKINLMDTAGFNEGKEINLVEEIGIKKSYDVYNQSSIIFLIFSVEDFDIDFSNKKMTLNNKEKTNHKFEFLKRIITENKKLIVCVNKVDLITSNHKELSKKSIEAFKNIELEIKVDEIVFNSKVDLVTS